MDGCRRGQGWRGRGRGRGRGRAGEIGHNRTSIQGVGTRCTHTDQLQTPSLLFPSLAVGSYSPGQREEGKETRGLLQEETRKGNSGVNTVKKEEKREREREGREGKGREEKRRDWASQGTDKRKRGERQDKHTRRTRMKDAIACSITDLSLRMQDG